MTKSTLPQTFCRMYITEISTASQRGLLVAVSQLSLEELQKSLHLGG